MANGGRGWASPSKAGVATAARGDFYVACTDDRLHERDAPRRYLETLTRAGWTARIDNSRAGTEEDIVVDGREALSEPPRWLRRSFPRQNVYGVGQRRRAVDAA
ncbi:hypothetical protein AB0I28_32340 [Phytomonospora sp. NPDC050363]|uniref:hypothetical protein n=1 Tax=Phytomonospora sp. NPDC050363 TaxID=3155642 RepID=UPI0033C14691